jgi:hypothetical protein
MLIIGLSQFITHLFGYGNPLSFIKEWVARKNSDPIWFDHQVQKIDDADLEHSAKVEEWNYIYDYVSGHSFFMRLFNCPLCLSSWVIIYLCIILWVNPIFILGANYLVWKLFESLSNE